MTTAAVIVGYAYLAVVGLLVLMVLAILTLAWAQEVRRDWRRFRGSAVVVPLYPETTNVRVLPRGEAS